LFIKLYGIVLFNKWRRIDDIDQGSHNVTWITASAVSKWPSSEPFTKERSIMTKDVVGLTDGSPGFHAKYYRSLRSETPPEELDTQRCGANPAPLPGGVVNSA
jgi:hypothetical protein